MNKIYKIFLLNRVGIGVARAGIFIGLLSLLGCSSSDTGFDVAEGSFLGAYTSDPFSMVQVDGPPELTTEAQEYWDRFTPDMDPAIQCYESGLARNLFSPAGVLVELNQEEDLFLSGVVVHINGVFPEEYGLDRRSGWPTSLFGYSVGRREGSTLFVETRGLMSRDILMGHIPVLPSEELIVQREYSLIPIDQRWEALGIAPQEVNPRLVPEGRTLQMEVWLDDPQVLTEVWHTIKHYREIDDASHVLTSDDIAIVDSDDENWESSVYSEGSGVPQEFLDNYDGGCVLFPEYAEQVESPVIDYIQ